MSSKAVNIAIVDDHTIFLKTLKSYISSQTNINVVALAPDIPTLLSMLNGFSVHILVMDLFMPHVSGLEAVKIIRQQFPQIKILVLSMCTDMELLGELLDWEVYGILSKSDEPEELIRAIAYISEEKIYQSKLLTEVMYWNSKINKKRNTHSADVVLSEREKQILRLLWEEKSNKEIAGQLFLSIRSVEKIRQDMKEKLEIKSTIGLLKYAIQKKIIGATAGAQSGGI